MTDIKSELLIVASKIEKILKEDTFPALIRPDFLREAVCDYPLRGGKRIRPALALWCCGCAGGQPDDAVYAACAAEIWHNWTLVHDDIIDGDDLRRGKPSTHALLEKKAAEEFGLSGNEAVRFGRDFAILAGDLAQSRAFNMLEKSRAKVSGKVMKLLLEKFLSLAAVGVISGEALDVFAGYRHTATMDELEYIIGRKTSDLIEFSAVAGALIGEAEPEVVANIEIFARKLGEAFQLRDDVLGVFGNVEKFGKPIGSDWREGKPTVLRLEAYKRANDKQTQELDSLWCLPVYGEEEISRLRKVLKDCGAKAVVDARAASAVEDTFRALERCPDNEYTDRLKALSAYLLDRDI